MDVDRYMGELTARQRRVFLALDQYADAATALLALVSIGLQWIIGTPGPVLLAAVALVCPAALVTYAVNRLCKAMLPKPRRDRRYHDLISPWLRGSFPSFHTQFAATFGAVFSAVVTLLAGPGVGAVAWASMGVSVALVAWSRLYLGVHDRVDVYGGLLLGGATGAAVAGAALAGRQVPAGRTAWALIAVLGLLVLAVSLWERRKRRPPR